MNTINEQNLRRYSHLEIISKQVVEGFITGLHKSPFHGFSVEFAEHRLYNQGESTKNIDWKLYGRSDKLFVKKFEEETNLRSRIVIDISTSMFFPIKQKLNFENMNKTWFSVYASACLIQLFKQQRDAFGLTLFSDKILTHTAARSTPVHRKIIFNELEKLLEKPLIENKQKTNVSIVLDEIAESINRRSLVVIFSDMFDDYQNKDKIFNSLQHLKHNKHEVILFHVLDKKHEIDFQYDNRPYKFIDLESGKELKLQPSEIKELYIKEMNKYYQEIKSKCNQYQIDYIEADINLGFHQILLPYLIKRQKML